MTDTTLAPVLRHRLDEVPPVGLAARLVVRWDRETGWAHLAIAVPGAVRARFVGFHRFADGATDVVGAELVAAGYVATAEPRLDDDLLEVHAVLTRREVAAHAVR